MPPKRSYRKKASKKGPAKLSTGVRKAVKAIVSKSQELRYFDYRVTAEQILNNQLSNASVSYYSEPCDVPLYSGAAATSMEGRTGNEIDIRRIRWAGKFKLVASSQPQLRLRFIAVRWANSSGNNISVGKITLNPTTTSTNYLEPIAPDCPYQILCDKRVKWTPPFASGTQYRDVVLDFKTPASASRKVMYSDTSTTIDYTTVMKGLIRIYWFEDNGGSSSAVTSIVSSQMRTWFKDL